ncbi:prepilin-type cleavage/methylation domain-containing protein [Paenibacillus sp. PK3_47]|uniref:prepilin-type N-terminal cleavage/methylation domain-containing protein n=1 Tax=Paenibacillus sp. PK3_47 TaxID=2072642 RepID=UPI00201E3A81|nr:prepilin-type N-terminal cleavage/methylation domain-containing protein [Paenibacillus sp. PK3_47]UQZ33817.1 prepilin-type cleavage/methylation domain-containing protein [Paenibacillus sp. PK3_47]
MLLKDKWRTIRNKEQGFTLIEVLAAIVILSIVSLVLTSYFTNALSYSKSNQNKTIMVNLARNALFYMEKQDFEKMQKFFDKYKLSADKCLIDACGDGTAEGIAYQQSFDTKALAHVLNPTVNGIDYSINVVFQEELLKEPESEDEAVNGVDKKDISEYLIPVKVVVTRKTEGGQSAPVEVEGYISNEEIR